MRYLLRTSLLALLSLATFAGTKVSAQTFQWTNYTSVGTLWSTAANWTPSLPTSSATTTLIFGFSPPNAPPTFPFAPVGNYTSTNDGATPFILNSIVLNGFGANDVASNGIVLTTNNAAGGFNFQGANPTITQNGTGSVSFANGTATSDFVINSSLTVTGSGFGHVNFSGVFTGNGDLNINHTGTSPLFSGGQIFIAPGAANTFAGNIVLNSGNLTLNTTSAVLAAGNQLVINGGTVRGSTAFTLPNTVAVQLNSQLVQTGVLAATYNSVVNGNGGIRIASTGSVTTTFANTISGTGAINIEGIGFANPTFTLSSQSATLHGTSLNASSYTADFAALSLVNGTAGVTRLNTAASLTMRNAIMTITGNTTAAINEAVASTNLSGGNQFTLTPVTAQPLALNLGTVTFTNRPTFQVTTQGAGLTLGQAPGTNGNANLFLGGVTAGDNINGVLPYGFAGITTGAGVTTTLVRYDNTNGVVPLNPATDYLLTNGTAVSNASTSNLLVNLVQGGTITGNRTVNSLTLSSPTTVNNGSSLVSNSGATYTLTSGVFATVLTGGTTVSTFPSIFRANINLPVTGYLHTQNFTALLGNIAGTNGLVKAGTGLTAIYGDNSALSGGITVNNGNLAFVKDTNLGAPGQPINLSAGQAGGFLSFNSLVFFPPISSNTVSINRPTQINGLGGLAVAQINTILNWDGVISGTGRFGKVGNGTLVLNGSNTFTGDVIWNATGLVASNDGALGDSSNALILTGTGPYFQPGSTFVTNRTFMFTPVSSAPAIFTNGFDLTITGQIVGNQTGTGFTKAGLGDLFLTNANTINGPIVFGDATPTRRPSGGAAQPGGTTILTGTDGALAGGTSYVLNFATLHLDNVSVVNTNRLASSQVTLNASELRMTGNLSFNSVEHIGRGSATGLVSNSLGNTVTLDQPASVGPPPVKTTLVATGYGEGTAVAITFFRGTDLGTAGTGGSNMRFVTAPTLTNGLIRSAVYADTPTGIPQDFATHTVANGIERFTAYVPLPTAGGVATATYSLTGALTQTGINTANALKMTDANIDLNGFVFNPTGAGAILVTGTIPSSITNSGAPANIAFGAAPARITVNTVLTLGNNVTLIGSGGLNKFGPGTLEVTASTITGPLNVSQGIYRLLSPAAWVSGVTASIQHGATLDFNDLGTPFTPIATMALVGFGNVNIGNGAIGTGAAATTYGGSFSGTGLLRNVGSSNQTLNGNSPNFSGPVQIFAGTITVDNNVVPTNLINPGPLGTGTTPLVLGNSTGTLTATLAFGPSLQLFERDIVVPGGVPDSTLFSLLTTNGSIHNVNADILLSRELRISNVAFSTTATGYTNFNGVISGPGSIDHFGGNFNFNGNNTYLGRTFFQAANTLVIGIGHNNAFGTGPMIIANQTFTASFRADNGARTVSNPFDYEAGTISNTIGFLGDNNLTFTAPTVTLLNGAAATTRTWNVVNTGLTTFTGNLIQTGGGAATLTKIGGGTLVLGGDNTFSGGLNINGGAVRITNTIGSGTGTGPVNINAGGRLEGTGRSTSAINVNVNGTFAAGASVGTIEIANTITFVANSFLGVFIADGSTPAAPDTGGSTIGALPNPTSNNFINKTGGIAPTGLALPTLLVDLDGTAFTLGASYSYVIAQGMGDQSALNVTAPAQFVFFNFHPTVTFVASPSMTGDASGFVYLNFTPVPEPTLLGVAAGLMLLAVRRRR